MIKKIIIKMFKTLGYTVNKTPKKSKNYSFNKIYEIEIKKNPIIFDVGANKGQSIERFRKVFPDCVIHSFEPLEQEFNLLEEKFKNQKNIILNNFALGEKKGAEIFYITAKSENSSFNKVNLNTDWIKIRSKQYNIDQEEFILDKKKIDIFMLDDYCEKHKIDFIDILKIDTSGFEHKVLIGAKKMIQKNSIHSIETEFMFDDVYEKNTSFYEFEKEIVNNNFRLYAIDHINGLKNIFEYMFGVYALYFNKNYKNKK